MCGLFCVIACNNYKYCEFCVKEDWLYEGCDSQLGSEEEEILCQMKRTFGNLLTRSVVIFRAKVKMTLVLKNPFLHLD